MMLFVLLSLLPANAAANCQLLNCALCDDNSSMCDICDDGYYLESSSCTECPRQCSQCTHTSICQSCVATRYNPGAQCSNVCSTDCLDGNCNDNGFCYGCPPGNYGSRCNKDCALCINGVCDLKGCTTGCKEGYIQYEIGSGYSECYACPENCIHCSNTSYCTQCEQGFYQQYIRQTSGRGITWCYECTEQCKQCTSIEQCPFCNQECVQQPPTSRSPTTKAIEPDPQIQPTKSTDNGADTTPSDKNNNNTITDPSGHQSDDDSAVIIGAVVGGVLFVVLVVVVVFVVWFIKRRSNNKDENHTDETVVDHIEAADYPVYAKPNKTSGTHEEDYMYAVPNKTSAIPEQQTQDNMYAVSNKPNKQNKTNDESTLYALPNKSKKPNSLTTGETEEPRKLAYNNVVVDMDMELVQETDVDAVQLEDVDEEKLTHNIDIDATIPTSDTYYNMEGIMRSQVKVTQLLDYVKKKTDYDSEFKKLPKGLQRTCDEALKPKNRKKNRYNGIYAYDATRVVLNSGSYINANYIDGHNQSRAYIASLGPTADTMNKYATFWEMVWLDDVEAIVMLTNLREGEKMKCEQYWPDQGMTLTCGKYTILCVAEKMFVEFVVREFELQNDDCSDKHSVVQYHYTAWPDRSVPDSTASLVAFRDKVEQRQRKTTSPMIVHCSAGIGRTGTYIALDILIKQGRDDEFVDMFGCAIGLRGQRVNMIQNQNQYEYLHKCVLFALIGETEVDKEAARYDEATEERITEK